MSIDLQLRTEANTYVPYEYLTITIDKAMQPVYQDTLRAFGWQTESVKDGRTFRHPLPFIFLKRRQQTKLTLKRDNRLSDRAATAKNQENALDRLAAVAYFERTKTRSARLGAVALGLLGCIPLAVSVFMMTAATVVAAPAIVVGALGILLWGAAAGAYRALARRRAGRVVPLIDEQYQNLYRGLGGQSA